MRDKTGFRTGMRILFLTALLSSMILAGCDARKEEAPLPEVTETTAATVPSEITVGNIHCDLSVKELRVTDAASSDLKELLPQLSNLETLILDGSVPSANELAALKKQFPDMTLVCQVPVWERTVPTDVETLDLSDMTIPPEELMEVLPLFDSLQKLTLPAAGLTDEEKMAVADSLPGVQILCELSVAGQTFMTDSLEMDISGCPMTVEEAERLLRYFPLLQKLDMSFCGITDEEMDALNRKYPEVSIIWTLDIAEAKVRTDAVYFYPAENGRLPTNEELKKLRYCTELIAVDLGHSSATDCEFLWYTPKVKYLILADTDIQDITPVSNLKELIYLELFTVGVEDYSPLLNCTKLQDLNIGTTYGDPEPLSKMTWLHNLYWYRSEQDPEIRDAARQLKDQLPDTNVVLYPPRVVRNTGGYWRSLPNYYVFRDIIGADYFHQEQIWHYWGKEDAKRILDCQGGRGSSAQILAQIIRERIDNQEPIVGIKNIGSEKAEILYESLLNAIS